MSEPLLEGIAPAIAPASNLTCGVWPSDAPCGVPAAETLIFCNPRCAGWGYLHVCAAHLIEYRTESLL